MLVNTGRAYYRGRAEAGAALFAATLYMGLSTDTTGPNAADTTISGEQTANGLQRQGVTAVHTTGTLVWTYGATFTYTGSTAVPIVKMMLWDAATGGNLITEDLVSLANFQANGDNGSYQVVLSF